MASLEGQLGSAIGGFASAGNVILWIIILAGLLTVCWFIYTYTQYNMKFRMYVLTKDRVLEVDDRLRKIVKKGQPTRWRLMRRRVEIPPPPSEAFRITRGGKFSLTAFYTEHGEFKYVNEDLKDKALFAKAHPILSEDHSFYARNYEEAKKWEHRDWSDVARQLIPYIIIFLIFVVFLAFWGKTVAPTLELSSQMISLAEVLRDAIDTSEVVNLS